jgi:hypothetical protein
MKYAFALLLGLSAVLGATAQAAPRLGDPAIQNKEAASPAMTQKVQYWPYGYGYVYRRPWFRHYYGGYYRPYWGGYPGPWGGPYYGYPYGW